MTSLFAAADDRQTIANIKKTFSNKSDPVLRLFFRPVRSGF